jgi:hypothetical protein
VEQVLSRYEVSERHACRLLGQGRGTQRYEPVRRVDEDASTRAIVVLAAQYGRCGDRGGEENGPLAVDRDPFGFRRTGRVLGKRIGVVAEGGYKLD